MNDPKEARRLLEEAARVFGDGEVAGTRRLLHEAWAQAQGTGHEASSVRSSILAFCMMHWIQPLIEAASTAEDTVAHQRLYEAAAEAVSDVQRWGAETDISADWSDLLEGLRLASRAPGKD